MPLDNAIVAYLRERFRKGDAILFTGAGFSRGARSIAGSPMPIGSELAQLIWPVCYPGEPLDPNVKLEDIFQVARGRNPKGLRDLLMRVLSVEPSSIPEYYAKLMSLPWYRAYTLNVDDLGTALARQYDLRRRIVPLSAIAWTDRPPQEAIADVLEMVHLNGVLDGAPDQVTFSPSQYAERLAGQEPLYAQCAADVLSRPVVFIGTPLAESPLWQHVGMRKKGTRTRGEFRRQSFIVTPSLDRARRELLEREFHVTHVSMDTEQFAHELLQSVEDVAEQGHELLRYAAKRSAPTTTIPLVQDLALADQPGAADYLLGRSPRWGDISDGVAAKRDCDEKLLALARQQLQTAPEDRGVILVTGTAGSGKSTSVRRLALTFTAEGTPVGWIDGGVEMSPLDLKRSASDESAPSILVIEDADRYGVELPSLVREITMYKCAPLVLVSIRSGRGLERFEDRAEALGLSVVEFVMPHLTDGDIAGLLDTLESHKRLGELRGKPRPAQIAAFREQAGREMIVALLQATSGRKFEDLVTSELMELGDETRLLYATVAVASALRFGLARDELLLSVDDASNATLASIDALQRRFLIAEDASGELRARHRVIAEVLMRHLARERLLSSIVTGLAVAAAAKVNPAMRANHKHYRRLRSMTNHDWLVQQLGVHDARLLYEELEDYVHWLHHYWLQRGSFELEHGDLQLAENFLNQAYSMEPHDALVLTEYAYLQLKLSVAEPSSQESRRLLETGFDLLSQAIYARRGLDPHQYHIYGRQALDWLRRGDVSQKERDQLLQDLNEKVEAGRKNHPRNELLRALYVDIQNERLGVTAD